MKLTGITLSLMSLLLIASCNKSSNDTASMSATINGATFAALGPRVTTVGSPGSMTTISASNLPVPGSTVNTNINLTVLNKVDTYYFNSKSDPNVNIYYIATETGGLPVQAKSGVVVVTQSTAHAIKGTFSFVASDTSKTYNVSGGQFTGTY